MPNSLWLYHYTDWRSARGIARTKKIYASTDTEADAAWGEGTYFTNLRPSDYSQETIAYNNWQRRLTSSTRQRLKYCIMVKFSKREIEDYSDDGRSIFLYEGDVDLRGRKYLIMKTEDYIDSSESESESEADTESSGSESEASDSDNDGSDSETSDSDKDSSESELSDSDKDSSESETSESDSNSSGSDTSVSDSYSDSD